MSEVVKTEAGVKRYRQPYPESDYGYYVSGVLLTMSDDTVWFHPYNGSKVERIECVN